MRGNGSSRKPLENQFFVATPYLTIISIFLNIEGECSENLIFVK
jgi:hypothetical protein